MLLIEKYTSEKLKPQLLLLRDINEFFVTLEIYLSNISNPLQLYKIARLIETANLDPNGNQVLISTTILKKPVRITTCSRMSDVSNTFARTLPDACPVHPQQKP